MIPVVGTSCLWTARSASKQQRVDTPVQGEQERSLLLRRKEYRLAGDHFPSARDCRETRMAHEPCHPGMVEPTSNIAYHWIQLRGAH